MTEWRLFALTNPPPPPVDPDSDPGTRTTSASLATSPTLTTGA